MSTLKRLRRARDDLWTASKEEKYFVWRKIFSCARVVELHLLFYLPPSTTARAAAAVNAIVKIFRDRSSMIVPMLRGFWLEPKVSLSLRDQRFFLVESEIRIPRNSVRASMWRVRVNERKKKKSSSIRAINLCVYCDRYKTDNFDTVCDACAELRSRVQSLARPINLNIITRSLSCKTHKWS